MKPEDFIAELGGVASTNQIAAFYGLSPVAVRGWASENGVPMIGNAFAFTESAAVELASDIIEEDDDGDWAEDDSEEECEEDWLGGDEEDDEECGESEDDAEEDDTEEDDTEEDDTEEDDTEEDDTEEEWDCECEEDDQHAAAAYYE